MCKDEVSLSPSSQRMTKITDWFVEARFGMFIHFGLYSIPAGVWKGQRMGRNDYAEWIETQGNWPHGLRREEYQALAGQFNPARFSADEWIDELVHAGMRYLVVTAKHHDGFALWPSKVSRFNVLEATPFRRDIIGELKAACDRRGVRLGLYYSHWHDWEHSGGGRPAEGEGFTSAWARQPSQEEFEVYWQEKCLPQVTELCDAYRPSFFWFDTWCALSSPWINEKRMDELIGVVKAKDPACLVNSRIGIWAHSKGEQAVDFLSMGDNDISNHHLAQPWETSGTLNHSWGYHQLDFKWKPAAELITNLISTTANGGNYQLNVGPTGEGVFQPAAIRRLREMGGWTTANGEAIYGAGFADLPEQEWGKITARSFAGSFCLYLHVLAKTTSSFIVVSGLTKPPKSARNLETGEPLNWNQPAEGASLAVTLPHHILVDNVPRVFVLQY